MKEETTITVSKAAEQYKIPKPTLSSWITKDNIIATRAGDGNRSPWMINVASLEAHLKENGKLPKSPDEEDQPTVAHSDSPPVSQEMPSLRDHHIAPVNRPKPNTEPALTPDVVTNPRPTRNTPHANRQRKTKNRSRAKEPPTYSMRITERQLKGALGCMTTDELLGMRNWLNDRIDKIVNS